MDFVDDRIVKAMGIQNCQAFGTCELLHRCDDKIAADIALRSQIPADPYVVPLGPHGRSQRRLGLNEDLRAMGDDQNPWQAIERTTHRHHIETGQPGFTKAGRNCHERATEVVASDTGK